MDRSIDFLINYHYQHRFSWKKTHEIVDKVLQLLQFNFVRLSARFNFLYFLNFVPNQSIPEFIMSAISQITPWQKMRAMDEQFQKIEMAAFRANEKLVS